MKDYLKREYERSTFKMFYVTFEDFIYLKKWNIEDDVDYFCACLKGGYRKELSTRRINSSLCEYMQLITPFI